MTRANGPRGEMTPLERERHLSLTRLRQAACNYAAAIGRGATTVADAHLRSAAYAFVRARVESSARARAVRAAGMKERTA